MRWTQQTGIAITVIGTAVITYQYNVQRTGANTFETQLTSSNVQKHLHAYSASDLGTELYNSNQNSTRDALSSNVKFAPVTVVNGKVYVGTKTKVVGYGLLP